MRRLRRRIEQWTGPPWPKVVRLVFILLIVVIWAFCYWFRLTSARGFAIIGFSIVAVMLVVKRILWKRSLAQDISSPADNS